MTLAAQHNPPAYVIYNAEGSEVEWDVLVDKAEQSDVVLFGELHDNHVGHWLEYELAEELINRQEDRILGAEMMEFDQQQIIDEYLNGFIVESSFKEDARLWSNYTDYKPLVELAKRKQRQFIATNIPRRYARTVFYMGLDTLKQINRLYPESMPDLPITIDTSLQSYANLQEGMPMHGDTPMYLMEAQAIKDAVMAHNICASLKENKKMIHYNGAYHSDHYEGINYYLERYCAPEVLTISMVTSENCIFNEENKQIADFIIVINKRL